MHTITIIYHNECGDWWAESPDLPSFFVTGGDRDIVRARVQVTAPKLVGEEVTFREVVIDHPAAPEPAQTMAGLRQVIELALPPGITTPRFRTDHRDLPSGSSCA